MGPLKHVTHLYYRGSTVVSVRIPEDLLKRARKEKIAIPRVVREALEREIRKKELERMTRELREEEWTETGIDIVSEI